MRSMSPSRGALTAAALSALGPPTLGLAFPTLVLRMARIPWANVVVANVVGSVAGVLYVVEYPNASFPIAEGFVRPARFVCYGRGVLLGCSLLSDL